MKKTYDITTGYRAIHGSNVHIGYILEKFDTGGNLVYNPATGKEVESKPKWNLVGYYPNMKQCIAKVVEEETLADNQVTTVVDYLNKALELADKLGGRFAN